MNKLLAGLVLLAMCMALASASMTEQDFRRMKIRELREFLDHRGLSCVGCQEKADFVRVAFQNRDTKPAGAAGKREVPQVKFWEAWKLLAKSECEKAVVKRGSDPAEGLFAEVCETISNAAESFFMQHGKRVASKLKKTPDQVLKTSYGGVYHDAGLRILQRLSNHCLASPTTASECTSLGFVMKLLDTGVAGDFKAWITNVGIENTNPMYEIVDQSDL